MRPRTACLTIAACLGVLAPSALAAPVPGDDVVREGTGERRAALDKMELSPFDQSLWSGLTDWTNGEPVTAADTAGKVVVIYTWAGYLPTAVRPISIVNRIQEKYADQGLIVVGVHHDEGWADGQREATRRRAAFRIARDSGNAMREALHVDQDPDFFVIDRSGRMRFADIDTGSLERAVSLLIDESTDDAESLLTRMAQADAAAAEEARRTARLRSQIDLSELPWVPFASPGEAAYNAADWPVKREDDSRSRSSRRGPSGPAKVDFEGGTAWDPGKPQHTEGRATLFYVFTPDIISQATIGGYSAAEFFQWMDQIQREHARDLQVVGIMVPKVEDRRSRRRDDSEDAAQAKSDAEAFAQVTRDLPVNHPRVYDPSGSIVTGKISPDNGSDSRSSRDQLFALPYHILASSDGMVRWHGAVGTSNERFAEWEAAFNKVLRNDPGIKARRAAEQAYIKSLTD